MAHNDTAHPHVHVIANRVDLETGRAASSSNDRLRLSRWAEGWERRQGRIRCPARVSHNREREAGEWVRNTGLGRTPPTGGSGCIPAVTSDERTPPLHIIGKPAVEEWHRREEEGWRKLQREREWQLQSLEDGTRREWSHLYRRQGKQSEALERLGGGGVGGRIQAARIAAEGQWHRLEEGPKQLGGGLLQTVRDARRMGWRSAWKAGRERGSLPQWREQLDRHHHLERAELGKEHSTRAGRIEVNLRTIAHCITPHAAFYAEKVQEALWRQERGPSRSPENPRPPSPDRLQPGPDRGGGFER